MESKSDIEQDLKDRMKNVKQWFYRVKTEEDKKNFIFDFMNQLVTKTLKKPRIIVFFNSKQYLDVVFNEMQKDPRLKEVENEMAMYHGDIEIADRKKLRADFDSGKLNILLTTNLVARGIDFYEVTAVINCDVPIELTKRKAADRGPILRDQIDTQTYIHRVGRAGRSNKKGVAILISNRDGEEEIIPLAKALDVQIHQYENFDQVKDQVDMCQKHNEAVNKETAASYDKTWTQIGISPDFETHLIKQKFTAPRPAQVKCVPQVLKFKANEDKFYSHISVFGFANGRGKTLCFLTPILETLKPSEGSSQWAPHAIIIAHSKDLCLQIGQVMQSIAPPSKKFEISYLFGGSETAHIRGQICIGTPGSIVNSLKKMRTDSLKFLVIDEADEVLEKSNKETREILGKVYEDVSPGFQFLLYSATFETDDFINLKEAVNDGDFNIDEISVESHFGI